MPGVLDENVVILKFDNSDFEKNTKQSMETLEQMKRSFKDSGSGEEAAPRRRMAVDCKSANHPSGRQRNQTNIS